jgi:hypothetical protein
MKRPSSLVVHGPFHRLLAPDVQDAETVVRQVLSGEIWGRTARNGLSPAVKAYHGALPDGSSGIEFWAFQAPDSPFGPRAFWRTHGEFVSAAPEPDTLRLQVAFVRITQDLLGPRRE